MVVVEDIQKDLPNWPEAVIKPWLIEFANDPDMGWPPPDPFGDHRWGRLLGNRPLTWWRDVKWTLEKVDCSFDGLTPKAKRDVIGIRTEISGRQPSEITKRRWDNIFRYTLNAGIFPIAPIVMQRPEGLSPLDGTHRMAVFSALQLMPRESYAAKGLEKPALKQEVWLGVHKDGELPLAQ